MANDQVYQLPVEVAVAPTDQKARTYQVPAEVLIAPTSGAARTSQLVVEVLYASDLPTGTGERVQAFIIG